MSVLVEKTALFLFHPPLTGAEILLSKWGGGGDNFFCTSHMG